MDVGSLIPNLCFLLAALLSIALYRALRRMYANRFVPRIREYVEEQVTAPEYEHGVWFCPQCFMIAGRKGNCENKVHYGTPVILQRGCHEQLEYYAEMRKVCGNTST